MIREMKDSGIEWIGKIPKEWDCTAILRLLKGRITDGPHETPTLQEFGIPFISVDSLNESDDVDLSVVKKFISQEQYEEYQKKAKIEKGDILFSKAATIGKTAIVKDEKFMVWSPLAIIKVSPSMCCNKFMYYILNCKSLIVYVSLLGTYNTQINVGMRALEKAIIPVPPLAEQQKIADYLDKVCGEIDDMIALQEKMIEELKAYKQSVITEAVTKGLNPNVPMRDSGIDWIGEIPEHWEMILFYKSNWIRARLGWKGLKAEEYTETGYPFLSAFNIINDKLDWSNLNYINKERYDESPEIKLSIGDLLLVKDGAGIGKCALVKSLPKGESTVNSSLAVVTPTRQNIQSNYQYYYFKSSIFQNTIWLLKIGMGVPHLTQENMKDIIIPCPPIEEQIQIVSFLDNKCFEIDLLIAIKQKKIDALKDYKKSLIYEYVTGKKQVN